MLLSESAWFHVGWKMLVVKAAPFSVAKPSKLMMSMNGVEELIHLLHLLRTTFVEAGVLIPQLYPFLSTTQSPLKLPNDEFDPPPDPIPRRTWPLCLNVSTLPFLLVFSLQ